MPGKLHGGRLLLGEVHAPGVAQAVDHDHVRGRRGDHPGLARRDPADLLPGAIDDGRGAVRGIDPDHAAAPRLRDPQRPVAGSHHPQRNQVREAAPQVGHDRDIRRTGDAIEGIQAVVDARLQGRQLPGCNPRILGLLQRLERVVQVALGALGAARHQILAVHLLLHRVDQVAGLGDGRARHRGAWDRLRRADGGQAGDREARGEHACRGHHSEQAQPATATLLAHLRARHRAELGAPARDEGQDPADQDQEPAAHRRLQPVDGIAQPMQPPADGVRQRDRALVREPGQGLLRPHRLEMLGRCRRWKLHHLHDEHPVGSGSSADPEQVLEMLHRLRRPQERQAALELVHPHHLGDVSRDETQAVVGDQLTLPGVRLDLERLAQGGGNPSLPNARVLLRGGGRRRELVHPPRADDHRGGGSQLRDVDLPGPHHDGNHTDAGAAGNSQLAAHMEEAAVRDGDRLAQRAEGARRQVVVVVRLDGFERLARRSAHVGVAAGHLGKEEEGPLTAHLGARGRLAEAQDVPRVGGSFLRHRESDTGCESVGHAGGSGGDGSMAVSIIRTGPVWPAPRRWSWSGCEDWPPDVLPCAGSRPRPAHRRAGGAPRPAWRRRPRSAPRR